MELIRRPACPNPSAQHPHSLLCYFGQGQQEQQLLLGQTSHFVADSMAGPGRVQVRSGTQWSGNRGRAGPPAVVDLDLAAAKHGPSAAASLESKAASCSLRGSITSVDTAGSGGPSGRAVSASTFLFVVLRAHASGRADVCAFMQGG